MLHQQTGKRRITISLVIAALSVSVVTGVALAGGSPSTVTTIDSCTTIEEPGHYRLGADIENSDASTCIEIETSDVVLDGDGRTVDGVNNDSSIGVSIDGNNSLSNVTVQNLTVTDWESGVRYHDVIDGAVTAVNATNTSEGIALHSVEETTVENNVVLGNDVGIFVDDSSTNNSVARNNAVNNTDGIALWASDDNAITNNTVRNSEDNAISLAVRSANNTLAGNTVVTNDYGIVIDRSNENEVTDNTVRNSTRDGIVLLGANNSTVAENTAANGRDGIALYAADRNQIVENEATDNERNGIGLYSSLDVVVRGNTLSGNNESILDSFSTGSIGNESSTA